LPKLEIISCSASASMASILRRHGAPSRHQHAGRDGGQCADLAIGMMLASARQIVDADRYVRSGEWLKGPIGLGRSVGGKTVGVVGLGGIGRAIADRAHAFRMKVFWHGPRPKPARPSRI
jgi:phosphoglycerate dehydrogenase-like enzyme